MKYALDVMSDEDKKEYWAALAFQYCGIVSPRFMRKLLGQYDSAYNAFCDITVGNSTGNIVENPLSLFPTKKFKTPLLRQALLSPKWRVLAEKEWKSAKFFYGEIILWTDYRYPLALKRIPDAPAFFYARGNTALLCTPTLAIVGSRKCQSHVLSKVHDLARELSSCGLCIVSGLAHGIDYAAHLGAMKETGKSIGILGCGIDVIYPKNHGDMYREMGENGLLLSEFAPNAPPKPQNFPIRNRLISALSEGVLVAEAAMRSGSLITARIALEQHRPVYVLKPNIGNFSEGCHALMSDGAKVVNEALDIIMDIAPQLNWEYNDSYKKHEQHINTANTAGIPNIADSTQEKKHSKRVYSRLKQNIHADNFSIDDILPKTWEEALCERVNAFSSKFHDAEKSQKFLNALSDCESENFSDAFDPVLPVGSCDNIKKKTFASQVGKQVKIEDDLASRGIDFAQMAEVLMGESNTFVMEDLIKPEKKKHISSQNPKKEIIKQNKTSEQDTPKHNPSKQDTVLWEKLSEQEQELVKIIVENDNMTPDELLMQLPVEKQNIAWLSSQLLMLEVRQVLFRLPGNRYSVQK